MAEVNKFKTIQGLSLTVGFLSCAALAEGPRRLFPFDICSSGVHGRLTRSARSSGVVTIDVPLLIERFWVQICPRKTRLAMNRGIL